MNSLRNLADTLEQMNNEIVLNEDIRVKAIQPLERMLSFNK